MKTKDESAKESAKVLATRIKSKKDTERTPAEKAYLKAVERKNKNESKR